MTERPEPGPRRLSEKQLELAKENLHIAEAIAHLVARRFRDASLDEIRSACFEAYTRAMCDFDADRGSSVVGFVWCRVVQAAWVAAKAPAFSPAALAALDVAERLLEGPGPFTGGDAEVQGHVLGSIEEIAGEHTLSAVPRTTEAIAARAALQALGPEDEALIQLRHIEGRPSHEVASLLGVSKATVDRRCSDLRERLRELLGE